MTYPRTPGTYAEFFDLFVSPVADAVDGDMAVLVFHHGDIGGRNA